MEEALLYLRGFRGERPLIAFIGPLCRTWPEDIDLMGIIMEMIFEVTDFIPVHAKPVGFDLRIRDVARWRGLESFQACEGKRTADVLDGVVLAVMFPDEDAHTITKQEKIIYPKQKKWQTADLELMEVIEFYKIPVLAVYRNGGTLWVNP